MSSIETKKENKNDIEESDYKPPEVNALGFDDIKLCLCKGFSDFRQAPTFGLFFGGIFAFAGILIVQSFYVWERGWLIYPMLVGFPLIGPFAAVGLYDVSRRLNDGLPLRWNEIMSVVGMQTSRQLPYMAFVMLFIFWVWMYQIRLLIAIILGRMSIPSWDAFFNIITTTPEGLAFIIIGHIVGACFALLLFSVTVVSIPIILDRDIDFVTAMITSVKTVKKSPLVMISWGMFIAITILISFIPLFLGLLIALPVLGHASWHVYKKAVV
ncbi:MAG: DUF2189 domain-containing protein [Proteobacteria bacterium]|nr:DUF2189 domain-containing protein [Pseudomonadota bacterium]NOG61183.1 DUF2189 domain-containing protein [Pseudomonadota bacterium]